MSAPERAFSSTLSAEALAHLFEVIATHFADGIVVLETAVDDHGTVEDFVCRLVTPRAASVLGRPEEDLLGERLHAVVPHAAAVEEEEGESLLEQCLRVFDTGEPYHGAFHGDGERGEEGFAVTATRWTGGVVVELHQSTAHRDPEGELHESEQRFRLLAENVSDVLIRAAPGGTVRYVSPASRRMLDQEPEDLIGRSYDDFVHPDDLGTARQMREHVLETGTSDSAVYRVRHGSGSYRWVETRARGVRAPETDDVVEIVAAMRDVTERQEAREALREAKREAEDANRAKSQFLANMSHELRTPLNAIIGYSEMMQDHVVGGEAQEKTEEVRAQYRSDLGRIHRAGKQLLALVNDVLDIAKIEAGEMEVHPASFEVAPVVMGAAGTIQPLVEENGNRFEIDCADHLGTMYSDKTKLRQVLFNLLGNAAKFTENGTVALRVERENAVPAQEPREEPRDWLCFAVEDTGIGLTAEEQTELFEAFAQADMSLNRGHEGTGLGLTISQNLCQMMGGSIELESEKGVGSTFTVRLPAAMDDADGAAREPSEALTVDHAELPDVPEPLEAAPEAPVHAGTAQEAAAVVEANAGKGERDTAAPADTHEGDAEQDQLVLVIDDDATARQIIGRRLKKDGFAVATAEGGREGLEKARALQPSVITLDVMMPEMDGWAVLSELQGDEALRDIPVVMVTIVEDESMGYMLGADDYLTKPVEANRLVSVVRRHSRGDGPLTVLIVEDDAATRDLIRRTLEAEEEHCVVREAQHGQAALDLMEQDDFRPDLILLDLMLPEVNGFAFLEKLRARTDEESHPIPVVVVTAKDLTAEERERLRGEVGKILQKGNYDRDELLGEVQRSVAAARRR